MARPLKQTQTLLYFDGPILIVATDPVETKYLCMLIEQLEERDEFVCAPVSDLRLTEFEQGRLDLLRIFESPEMDELYAGSIEHSADEPSFAVELVQQIPEHWYPKEGFFLKPRKVSEAATIEAKERDKAVIHLAFNPPEARDELRIEAQHLASGLQVFQNLVKHAYNRSIRPLSRATRDLLTDPSNYQMEVFGFSSGSFTVTMQSKVPADWTGQVNIEKALNLVDDAIAASSELERALSFLNEHAGHFLTAYRDLLEFIVENDSPLKYEWSTPEFSADRRRAISVNVATELHDMLTSQKSMTAELVTLIGVVTAVSTDNDSWTLLNEEDNTHYSGKIAPESSVQLGGITVETERYRFECEERLQEFTATGKEKVERLLLYYTKLEPFARAES